MADRLAACILIIGTVVLARAVVPGRPVAQQAPRAKGLFVRHAVIARSAGSTVSSKLGSAHLTPIAIDYPEEGSVFPPEITAPTFLWRDADESAAVWLIEVAFADGSPGIKATSQGERLPIGEIDPRCIAATNELPKLTAQQAAQRTWTPDETTWASIKRHSTKHPATVTLTGFRDKNLDEAVSSAHVTIQTSKDPVGAPIFYRDVPLMPSELEKGVIKPLPASALPLIAWRLRYVGESRSRLLLEGLHTCANCHSFSHDGKTFGMILDGALGDKGLYAFVPVRPQMVIRNQDVISWTSSRYKPMSQMRIGFMAQVSPDGQYVVSMINGTEEYDKRNYYMYYVANFKDYRFLQVFYPTRGILAYYSRATGRIRPLPGADDLRYVQTSAVWSPDGKYLVFAKAEANDPYPPGSKMPKHANDPDETPIRYDLYRIPFNGGEGGQPQPILGASGNGESNSFPKVSPDGRWIVFVKSRNGQLLRPDSQLYIIPADGGRPRRMRCNTSLMNSWHSFSPNGRWLVFSSKSRSPYTQMYLTHLDDTGNDSPAILIENAAAANRAVNIPEFANVPPDGLAKMDVPAAEFYRLFDHATELAANRHYVAAIAEWKKALELDPEDARAHVNLGIALMQEGEADEAITHLQEALRLNPDAAEAHDNMGIALIQKGKLDEAISHLQKALELSPDTTETHDNMGIALMQKGKLDDAITYLEKALDLNPRNARAHFNLGNAFYWRRRIPEALAHWREGLRLEPDVLPVLNQTAWVLATCPEPSVRNGTEAVGLAEQAVQLSGRQDPAILYTLAAAYAELGRFPEAAQTARRALSLATEQNRQPLAQALKAALTLYDAKSPFRETQSPSSSPLQR